MSALENCKIISWVANATEKLLPLIGKHDDTNSSEVWVGHNHDQGERALEWHT